MARNVLSCKAVTTQINKKDNTIKEFHLTVTRNEYIDFHAMNERQKTLFIYNHKNTTMDEIETFD